MRGIHRSLRWLAATALVGAFLGNATANAFEAHNFIAPPFGSFTRIAGIAVDESNGNVYVQDINANSVQVFGPEGGAPLGGGPSSFKGTSSPAGSFSSYAGGVAVDNACYQRERLTGKALTGAECATFDPAAGDIYVYDSGHTSVDKYKANGSGEYEYLSQLQGGSETGLGLDSAGDVYALLGPPGINEFNTAGKPLQTLASRFGPEESELAIFGITPFVIAPDGTIYAQAFAYATGHAEVVELKRSSLTGTLEGEPTVLPNTEGVKGLAFDQAQGQLYVDLGSSGEALNAAHEVVSRFGTGVIAESEAIAIDEATGEVYVTNGSEQKIDRFGPGLIAKLPVVDEPAPSASNVRRTSALISGQIDPENATTSWHMEYVVASEYAPGGASPYAGGGSTATHKLAPTITGESIGPLPLTGLLAGTTYHYRLVASNELGTTYGQDHTFMTAPATPPVVGTGVASEVTQTSVELSGVVESRGLQSSYEFEVGIDQSYGGAKLFGNAGRSGGPEPVSTPLQYLIPGTTYHYRLLATNEDGTTYGQDMTFTTPTAPTPVTQPATAALISSPTVQFPSVAGAITKPQSTRKGSKKTKRKAKRRKQGKNSGKHNGKHDSKQGQKGGEKRK